MSLVGVTLKEKKRGGRAYTVVGEDQGGYVLAPVEFGRNERVTAADLAARFGAEVDDPQPVDEQTGWKVLGEKFDAAVDRQSRGESEPPAATPEQRFSDFKRISDGDARRLGHRS